ncbi:MAG TPA: hypothetical protein VKY92_24770, partial [Verrucomicrobiae bacterium]|nr:hypothetical protein [Verrucomicrobiae bacterium]
MKTLLGSRSPWLLAWAASLQIIACTRAYGQANAPAMSSIHPEGTNVVVEVSVPSGFHRISLQTKSRLGSGAWVPVAVGQNDGSAKT